jgi:hypothetical protein
MMELTENNNAKVFKIVISWKVKFTMSKFFELPKVLRTKEGLTIMQFYHTCQSF